MSQAALVQPPVSHQLGEIVISEAQISARVNELGARISSDYQGSEPVLAAVLTGAWIFACDLSRRLRIPAVLDAIALARYRRSPGISEVQIIEEPVSDLAGRDVLIVEDIVDTGLTVRHLVRELERRKPATVAVCSLLDRPGLRLAEIPLRYVGFEVDESFLVGYGLDYREQFRNLPDIRHFHPRGTDVPPAITAG